MKNFGINGFGRIGRTALRIWWLKHQDKINLKMINTSGSMELTDWVHLLKHDTNYGLFQEDISINQQRQLSEITDENPVLGVISIKNKEIVFTAQRDPSKIPWKSCSVETVIESTGVFTTEEKAATHFEGGAKKVIISAPSKGGEVSTSVIGVNEFDQKDHVFSNASCTTNCVAPVAKIMLKHFGVEKATLTTIHSYTDDQNVQDNSHKDLRRARSAAENIIPTSTGAAKTTAETLPELKGLFDGLAVRVPTPVGSLSDLVFVTKKNTTVEELNNIFTQEAAKKEWQGILAVTTEPLVSSDIIGRDESAIIDLSLTQVVGGNLIKVIAWYDNEWGYCNRLIEQITNLN